MEEQRIYSLVSEFEVLKPINWDVYFSGPHWSALLRELYRRVHHRPAPSELSPVPLNIGPGQIPAGGIFKIMLTFTETHWNGLREVLLRFNEIDTLQGHMVPFRDLQLRGLRCALTGVDALVEGPVALQEAITDQYLQPLESLQEIEVFFYTPLRLPRPPGTKTPGHHFVDGKFLIEYPAGAFVKRFLERLRYLKVEGFPLEAVSVNSGVVLWVDVPYGRKTLGGMVGRLRIEGLPREALRLLLYGVFTGSGKNKAFGFGYYHLCGPESPIMQGFEEIRPAFTRGMPVNLKHLRSVTFVHRRRHHEFEGKYFSSKQLEALLKEAPEMEEIFFGKKEEMEPSAPLSVLVQKRPLFLTRFTRKVFTSGPALVVEMGNKLKVRVPWSAIGHLYLIGKPPVSAGVLYKAISESVPVTIMDMLGRTRAHLWPEGHDVPPLQQLQMEKRNDPAFCLSFAKEIVSAKVHNSAVLLRRNSAEPAPVQEILSKIETATDIETLRGYEGIAARRYFEAFSQLVLSMGFKGRRFHPPDGPINAMLSFCYSLLYSRLASLIHDMGLNPRLGFYHHCRGSHAALASDLMEELRHVAERVVLKVVHRAEVTEEDFTTVNRKGRPFCQINRSVVSLLVERFEEIMHTESSLYGGGDLYAYLHGMVNRFVEALRGGPPYRALRIR